MLNCNRQAVWACIWDDIFHFFSGFYLIFISSVCRSLWCLWESYRRSTWPRFMEVPQPAVWCHIQGRVIWWRLILHISIHHSSTLLNITPNSITPLNTIPLSIITLVQDSYLQTHRATHGIVKRKVPTMSRNCFLSDTLPKSMRTVLCP